MKVGNRVVQREVTVGGGHAGGQLGWTHFGAGDANSVEVRVQWPDGEMGRWLNVTTNRLTTIERGAEIGPSPGTRADEGMSEARLTEVELPDFGNPGSMPVIPDPIYQDRMERSAQGRRGAGYDRIVVYADREHSANLSYLTGFDPRFEEALPGRGRRR